MATKKVSKHDSGALINLCLILAALFTVYNFVVVLSLIHNLKFSILGSPSVYSLIPAALLSIYVLIAGQKSWEKYISVILLTVLVVDVLVWFFAVTGVSALIFGNSSFILVF